MSITWRRKFDPDLIARKLEDIKVVDEAGKVGFQGWNIKQLQVLLHSMMSFPKDVPQAEARRIVSESIFQTAKNGLITAKLLLQEANRLNTDFRRRPQQRFALAASLSVDQSAQLHTLRPDDVVIVFEASLRQSFRCQATSVYEDAEYSLFAKIPKNYSYLIAFLSARSESEAANKALNSIELVRGIWNFWLNRQTGFRISFMGTPKPVNQVLLGPVHTLHETSGKLATSRWWYEPLFVGSVNPFAPNDQVLASMYAFHRFVRRKLKTSNYRSEIESAITRYSKALDGRDWHTSYLDLWSVLEMLTNTDKGRGYDQTIRRASFLYADVEYNRQVLKHLRDYRNHAVHKARDNSEIETYLYQLKEYVESLIEFHIENKPRFRSIQEASEFLDLPFDQQKLANKATNIRFAQKLHS